MRMRRKFIAFISISQSAFLLPLPDLMLTHSPRDLSLMHEVDLVLDEHHRHVFAAFVLNFTLPLANGVKRGPIRRRKGHNAGLSASVIRLGDGIELLLAGRVPQHESHVFRQYPMYGGRRKSASSSIVSKCQTVTHNF